MYNYSDEYNFTKKIIILEDTNVNNWTDKELTLKNSALLWSSISKINNTFIENSDDLNVVMPIYSDKHSMTSESLWNYFWDEVNDNINKNNNDNLKVNNQKTTTSKYFKNKE